MIRGGERRSAADRIPSAGISTTQNENLRFAVNNTTMDRF